jgi:hypothetical protein
MNSEVCLKRILDAIAGEQGQIWSWVLGIFLVVVILGILITQCGPIIANYINVGSTATDAADEAASVYQKTRGNMSEVQKDVSKFLEDHGARLAGDISVDTISGETTIYVPVRKIVNTFLFSNVSYLCSFTEASAEGKGTVYK